MNLSTGEKIQIQRKRKKLTQKELANKVGVSSTAVMYWETSRTGIGTRSLKKLSEVLGVPPSSLIGEIL